MKLLKVSSIYNFTYNDKLNFDELFDKLSTDDSIKCIKYKDKHKCKKVLLTAANCKPSGLSKFIRMLMEYKSTQMSVMITSERIIVQFVCPPKKVEYKIQSNN